MNTWSIIRLKDEATLVDRRPNAEWKRKTGNGSWWKNLCFSPHDHLQIYFLPCNVVHGNGNDENTNWCQEVNYKDELEKFRRAPYRFKQFPDKKETNYADDHLQNTNDSLKTKNTGDKGHECSIMYMLKVQNEYPVDWLFSVSSRDEIPTKRNSPWVYPKDSKFVKSFGIYKYQKSTWSYDLQLHSFSSRFLHFVSSIMLNHLIKSYIIFKFLL